MKAAIIRRFSEPYDIANVPIPRVEPGQCLVRVMATGLCGTDLKIAAGAFPDAPLPMIPGHEVAGEVVEDVGPLKKGQRVAIHTFNPCGNCRWCRLGQETLCPNPPRIGFNRDGGSVAKRHRRVCPMRHHDYAQSKQSHSKNNDSTSDKKWLPGTGSNRRPGD